MQQPLLKIVDLDNSRESDHTHNLFRTHLRELMTVKNRVHD